MFAEQFTKLSEEINNYHSAEIPEHVLVSKYLPLLFAAEPMEFNMVWIKEVAGTPINPVKIINSKGEVIGEVPPLRESPKGATADSFNYQLSILNLQTEQYGHLLQGKTSDTMALTTDMSAVVTPSLRDRWIKLLVDYGFENNLKAINMVNNNEQKQPVRSALTMEEESDDAW